MKYIALDLGTSGFRAQAIDEDGSIISTVITARHPLPGANVMDQLHFCINFGQEITTALFRAAVQQVISELGIDLSEVKRLAVCGNPIQLSLFEGIEVKDLAYAGKNALKRLGVEPVKRDAKIRKAADIGLDLIAQADVLIPPAVRHEIGADALAMMYMTGMLDNDEIALVTDYGTNAEMALKIGDQIFTGSSAAGPALEGQHISAGMLAAPGAIADIERLASDRWQCLVLNENLESQLSAVVDLIGGQSIDEGCEGQKAKGITGTGVIAAIAVGIDQEIVGPPTINTPTNTLFLQDGVQLTEKDIKEAGKAIGAIRAGHLTLLEEASINMDQVKTVYMTGASGTYVDARKAQRIGLVPGSAKKIVQAGNTSLSMAVELAKNPKLLEKLQEIANGMRANHIMFADSNVFKNCYAVELAYWDEGMPFKFFNKMLKKYKIQTLPEVPVDAEIIRLAQRDIIDIGSNGLQVLQNIGTNLYLGFDQCSGCESCAVECPEDALQVHKEQDGYKIVIRSDYCNGTACRRCEDVCPVSCFKYEQISLTPSD